MENWPLTLTICGSYPAIASSATSDLVETCVLIEGLIHLSVRTVAKYIIDPLSVSTAKHANNEDHPPWCYPELPIKPFVYAPEKTHRAP